VRRLLTDYSVRSVELDLPDGPPTCKCSARDPVHRHKDCSISGQLPQGLALVLLAPPPPRACHRCFGRLFAQGIEPFSMWWPHSSYTEKISFDKEIFFELLLYNIKKGLLANNYLKTKSIVQL